MKRISAIVFLFIFSLFFFNHSKHALGFESSGGDKNFSYYFLSLFFDSKTGTVALDEKNGAAVDLTNYNLTKDAGTGSQFYAKVIDSKNQPESFSEKGDRFFLGKWEMRRYWDGIGKDKKPTGGSEIIDKGPVSVSVPYFPDGQKIEIYDTKTNKLALSVDVSKFSKVTTVAVNQAGNISNASQPAAENASAQTVPKQSFPWLWIAVGVFVLLIIGAGFIFYKRYKGINEQIPPPV